MSVLPCSRVRPVWLGALVLSLPLALGACGSGKSAAPEPEIAVDSPAPGIVAGLDLGAPVPIDPAVTTGQLDNGLQYYVRENPKPENRAALWLCVAAGSVDEDDDQLGLAHMTEHMAFNGTENFPRQELVDYLETIGMQFGPEVNAFTSLDRTVYMLQVPTDRQELLDTGLEILEDWAHRVSFVDEEIDKERGVIVEEWRLGRGADARMYDQQLPVLYHGSKYAERKTIGEMDIIQNFPHDTIRRFYRDWYRPDLMAVIAVGDFDGDAVTSAIAERFGAIPAPENPRPLAQPEVPDHPETLYGVATDPEAARTMVAVVHKRDPEPVASVADWRAELVGDLVDTMLRARLNELSQQPDPPFSFAYVADYQNIRTKRFFTLGAWVKEDGVDRGLDVLVTEVERARRHGFTASELARAKAEMLRRAEKAAAEQDKTESRRFAWAYQSNFLRATPIPGPATALDLESKLLPTITLAEVDARLPALLTEGNRVITVEGPQKEGLPVPQVDELAAVLATAVSRDVGPYVDTVVDAPLVTAPPTAGRVVERRVDSTLGTETWTLSNGVRVVLKPTDFKNDEVLLWGVSPGGSSLIADDGRYRQISSAASVVAAAGVGAFDPVALDKKLAGKIVRVFPYISDLEEGLRGSGSPEDLETMLKLTYLYATAPRDDEEAFASLVERQRGWLQNRAADPDAAFQDTIQALVNGHDVRRMPPTEADLDALDRRGCLEFYRDRFADCSDFTFFLVGAIDPLAVEPLVRTWLGGLPAGDRDESWRDPGIPVPQGVQERTVARGIEPRSRVELVFVRPAAWSWENVYAMESLADALRIQLRQEIREEKSGTYGVGVRAWIQKLPDGRAEMHVSWGCDPDRVDELTAAVWDQLHLVQRDGPAAETLTKVRETQLREHETNLQENQYWLGQLVRHERLGTDPHLILSTPDLTESLTAEMVRDAARRYISDDDHIRVVLMPAPGES